MRNCFLVVFFFFFFTAKTLSCEHDCVQENSWAFGIALGIGKIDNPLHGGEDGDFYALPSFYYYGESFYVENLELGYTFIENDKFDFSLIVTPNNDGVYFNDSLLDTGIGALIVGPGNFFEVEKVDASEVDRDISVMSGFKVNIRLNELMSLSANLTQDITGTHNGTEAEATLLFSILNNPKWALFGELGINYKSDKLANYYYGIRPEDGALVYEHKIDAFSNAVASFGFNYNISERLTWVSRYTVTANAQNMQDSFLVEDRNSQFWFNGISYTWGGGF